MRRQRFEKPANGQHPETSDEAVLRLVNLLARKSARDYHADVGDPKSATDQDNLPGSSADTAAPHSTTRPATPPAAAPTPRRTRGTVLTSKPRTPAKPPKNQPPAAGSKAASPSDVDA